MTVAAEISHPMMKPHGSSPGVPLWLRRTLLFLLLGPALGAFAAVLTAAGSGTTDPYAGLIMMIVFVFGLLVAVPTAIADAILSKILPIAVRAPSTAAVAATVALASLSVLFGPPMQDAFTPIGGVAAFCAGVCSLLSHDYGRNRVAVKD